MDWRLEDKIAQVETELSGQVHRGVAEREELRLEAESAVRLVETYEAAQSEYMNVRLPFQSPVSYKRSVLISYLDDEMLVVRDALGRPDVLMRVTESSAWAPSSLGGEDTNESDDAPGAS